MSESPKQEKQVSILIVDDEPIVGQSLGDWFRHEGYRVETASGAKEALRMVAEREYDIALLDIKMPGIDGLELQERLSRDCPDLTVIIMTAYASVDSAVRALKSGAYDYITKPFDPEELSHLIRRASEHRSLRSENLMLKEQLASVTGPSAIVGVSRAIGHVLRLIDAVAATDATVLIRGESGTGKELVARAIHTRSNRRFGPLVVVNCGALPEGVLESELFGHEKGAFTGAQQRRKGKFELADGGTIFLDEIGDMSPRTQAKVLRVLQNGEVEPVGAERVVRVNVRVVAATNRDLAAEMQAGRFREDLYFRLNVVPVRTPALREHIEDLPLLVDHFVRLFGEQQSYRPRRLDEDALAFLRSLPWRGNVRELKNLVERLLILAPGPVIDRAAIVAAIGAAQPEIGPALLSLATLREFRDEAERLFLLRKLEENDWNVSQTAQAIDTPRSNLYKKMEQYAIRRPDDAAAD